MKRLWNTFRTVFLTALPFAIVSPFFSMMRSGPLGPGHAAWESLLVALVVCIPLAVIIAVLIAPPLLFVDYIKARYFSAR